ncbi:MAG: signal peptidase I [Treponema sp.]|nr:signal peptidase I [Treponema sp.]
MNTTKEFKNLLCKTYINLGAALLFTLLLFPLHFDISALAFPIALVYCALLVYFAVFKTFLKTDGSRILVVIKLTEYLPYLLFITFIIRRAGDKGTPFWYDVVTVILWFVVFVLSYFTSRCLYPKKNTKIVQGWAVAPKEEKRKGGAFILFEALGWVDALVWSIFTILIFQIFFLQLYEIPSESMVPTFLIKDRAFVSKIDCGPKFPLTDVGLPDFRKYKRGDTIVLRNPHYTIDRKSEVKTVTSQLIYMLSIMTVNLNKDDNGELKADPLVKRITGLPGEQLVMQDGVLYTRTSASDEFKPSEIDAKYAMWNLSGLPQKIRQNVHTFPLSSSDYEAMLDFEEERRSYDLNAAAVQARALALRLEALAFKDNLNGTFTSPDLFEYYLFRDVQDISRRLITQEGGAKWFENFMTSWIPQKDQVRDMYAESNFRLNVMTKITFGKLALRFAELFTNGTSSSAYSSDSELNSYYADAEKLNWYIQSLLDERNMPVFPANDEAGNPQYIPNNCYFMMGDNRFNSLDLRHSSEQTLKPLSSSDKMSVQYYSMMAPQYINKKYIIGKPVFRFWPLNRFGKV